MFPQWKRGMRSLTLGLQLVVSVVREQCQCPAVREGTGLVTGTAFPHGCWVALLALKEGAVAGGGVLPNDTRCQSWPSRSQRTSQMGRGETRVSRLPCSFAV